MSPKRHRFEDRAPGTPVIYGPMPKRKVCSQCKKEKRRDHRQWSRRNGERWYVELRPECNDCKNAFNRKRYALVGRRDRKLKPAQVARRQRSELTSTARLTVAEHETWWKNERALRERLASRCRRISVSEVYATSGAF